MKAILDDRQALHNPKHFFVKGQVQSSPEKAARIDVLRKGAEAAGCHFETPTDHGIAPLASIHSAEYLEFLETIHARWTRLDSSSDEVIPNIHPSQRNISYPQSPVGQAGYHQADTACPISAGTWDAAYWSAQSALSGADVLLAGEPSAYSLCRPPGHHAFGDLAGGFCFLNNSAIAADYLRRAGHQPAILDIDVHHGNGTQGIFYARADVQTVSIHADPANFYPFFWGHAHERGDAAGRGYNLNLPLQQGTGDQGFLDALDTAIKRIETFGTDVLVVALGLDAYENDPLRGLAVTTLGFAKIGARIAKCKLPTLFVQEGGYLSEELGQNLSSILNGFTRNGAR